MKITRKQLRKIIREAVESEYYKNLKARGTYSGELTRAGKSHANLLINDLDELAKEFAGKKEFSNMDIVEIKWNLYKSAMAELKRGSKTIDQDYDKKIRQPYLQAYADRPRKKREVSGTTEMAGSHLDNLDDHFWG